MPALPIQYTQGLNENKRKEYRSKLLRGKKDVLFYDEWKEEKLNLAFCSTLVREWLDVIKRMYPDLKETQQDDLIKLKSKEGTIYFMSSVKVLVHGEALRATFERDFEEMKQNVQTQSLETTPQHEEHEMSATPERCLTELSEREREDKLQANKDFLFNYERKEKEFIHIFCSTLVREWLDVMKRKYPDLEETQQDNLIKLKSEEGTISFMSSVEVVVIGEELMERFEKRFEKMKQDVQRQFVEAELAQLNVNQPEQTAED